MYWIIIIGDCDKICCLEKLRYSYSELAAEGTLEYEFCQYYHKFTYLLKTWNNMNVCGARIQYFELCMNWLRAASQLPVHSEASNGGPQLNSLLSAEQHVAWLSKLSPEAIACEYKVAAYVRINLDSYELRGKYHDHPTRSADHLASIRRTLTKSAKLTHGMGPDVYNHLPEHVTIAPSLQSFKTRLQSWLIEQAFYSYDEFYKFLS